MAEAGGKRQGGRGRIGQAAGWPGAALALLLAGCSTVVPKGGLAPPPPRRQAPPPPVPSRPATGALPEDQARHRVALLVPLTGPNAAVGQSIANAAAMALADSGGTGLRITNYDTGTGAAAAAARAIGEGAELFLGPLLADDVRAVAPAAAAAHVPVVAFSNDAAAAGDDVWLLGFSPGQSVERVVRYARSRGLTRFAGLVPQGLYGRSVSTALIRAAEAAGGSVVAMQSYQRTPKSIGAAVAALSKQKFDAFLIADSGRVAVQVVPMIRKAGGASARLMGTELWNAEPGLNASPAMAGGWFASVDDGTFAKLGQRYKARYGRTPYRLASLGYDGVLLTARVARGWVPGTPFPLAALSDPGGFAGVDGAFRFGPSHVAERGLAVHQLGSGGGTVVSPAPTQF